MKSGSKNEPTASASPELRPWQRALLDALAGTALARDATFGGATALAAVYLHHRQSENIDLFLMREPTDAEVAEVVAAVRGLRFKTEVRSFDVRKMVILTSGCSTPQESPICRR